MAQDRQQLLDTIAKFDRRVRILAAMVRVLLAMLRASGFTLAGERLPEGSAKAGILRAIASAKPFLPLAVILWIVHLKPGRYHAWNSRASALTCGLDDRSFCPRTSPGQLTPTEVANIKDMVLAPEKRHMSLRTLPLHAQRIGKVFASATTWAKLVRERRWLRPRQRIHPPKPTLGVRAAGGILAGGGLRLYSVPVLNRLVLALSVILWWGCAAQLTQQGAAVLVADENIVRQCQYLGDVTGSSVDNASARNDARNRAAAMGATHAVFVSESSPVITGPNEPNTPAQTMARAYRCPGNGLV